MSRRKTQDDTFNKLRKPSYEEISVLYHKWYFTENTMSLNGKINNGLSKSPDELFEKYGWTFKEYQGATIGFKI